MHKRASIEDRGNLIFPAQAFDWTSRNGANSLLVQRNELAEREGFEPPLPLRVNLISSPAIQCRNDASKGTIGGNSRSPLPRFLLVLLSPAPLFSPTFLYRWSEERHKTMRQVTFGDFAKLAKQRHWSAESLATMFRGKIDHPSEFFHRVLSGAAPLTMNCLSVSVGAVRE